VKESATKS